ncbi:hypothetical protein D6C87_01700 [Aureobasidium pullulans]|uniref:Uncharacterized protein n=1 Tax=Aureobasidium pullulans TaxID=5580 RepID=A0AB38LAH0_AURPU|nr:hypothetical protein D6D12_08988 [Aureobasidium pullulans]THX62840.1 hypothetical protein D6D11_02231 [Aureobasidium pullulans]THY74902.1 hypothetical protein D6C94_04483 [Aureobasidium pullulans]THZ47018.1 hypothetical protein D6C87_01700 [Aureobasidium pullulans]
MCIFSKRKLRRKGSRSVKDGDSSNSSFLLLNLHESAETYCPHLRGLRVSSLHSLLAIGPKSECENSAEMWISRILSVLTLRFWSACGMCSSSKAFHLQSFNEHTPCFSPTNMFRRRACFSTDDMTLLAAVYPIRKDAHKNSISYLRRSAGICPCDKTSHVSKSVVSSASSCCAELALWTHILSSPPSRRCCLACRDK